MSKEQNQLVARISVRINEVDSYRSALWHLQKVEKSEDVNFDILTAISVMQKNLAAMVYSIFDTTKGCLNLEKDVGKIADTESRELAHKAIESYQPLKDTLRNLRHSSAFHFGGMKSILHGHYRFAELEADDFASLDQLIFELRELAESIDENYKNR